MNKTTEFLDFIDISNEHADRSTVTAEVRSKRSEISLGVVQWFGPWRRYAFYPSPGTIFDFACLTNIADYISELMNARKPKKN